MSRFKPENPRQSQQESEHTQWELFQEWFWEFVLYTVPNFFRKLFGGGDEPPRFRGA